MTPSSAVRASQPGKGCVGGVIVGLALSTLPVRKTTPLETFLFACADVVAVAAEAAAVQGDHLLHQERRAQIDARSSKQQARPEHAGRAVPTRSGGAWTPHLDAGARASPAPPNSHTLSMPPFCSSDAHARCLLPREAHHRRARGGHLLLARAGRALPVRPLC